MATKCPDGKVSLISINALHQLHIFIFFLAVFHVSINALHQLQQGGFACSLSSVVVAVV